MEGERESCDAGWVCPFREETACFSRGAAGDARCFEEGDGVKGGVVGRVAREIVGCCTPYNSAPWRLLVVKSRGERIGLPTITMSIFWSDIVDGFSNFTTPKYPRINEL